MINISEIAAKTKAMFGLFNAHFYNSEMTRPATVDKNGTVTGSANERLMAVLQTKGFMAD